MNYKICWWEDNGYHDSYFYGVYFDTADYRLHRIDLGSTAYANPIGFGEEYLLPTPEIVELARLELADRIFSILREAEDSDVLRPGPHNVQKDRAFRLLEPHSYYLKAAEDCDVCGGTGQWRNPKNADDVRPCFRCHGCGRRIGKAFLKGTHGKRLKVTLQAGTVILSSQNKAVFFGVEFAKGYNHPNRENSSVACEIDHQRVLVPMHKLRQNCDPMSDGELRIRAEELSYNHEYGAAFGCKAWLTRNWAQEVAEESVKPGSSKSN